MPPPPGSPPPALPNTPLSTLTLHPAQNGTLPYLATVYPLEGAVPSGQVLSSADDLSLRSSVVSRWPDGSAAVVVLAGETAFTAGTARTIRLQTSPPAGIALAPARIGQVVSNITVDCGTLGVASLSSFASPARIWWANERLICARYRAPVGSDPTLEAVIDIHAFSSNRALIEVVIENCKVNSSSPALPGSKSYTASVSVNGSVIATTSTGGAPGGAHRPFRAWFASHWVGGDPGIEVTHDVASMQSHPLLFRVWKSGAGMSAYANDSYVPWGVGRHPRSSMGAAGDSSHIGPLPLWESHYLQSGDRNARRAVLASALSVLTFNVNYRDSTTGLVPTFDQLAGRNQTSNWPRDTAEPGWVVSHHPAAGLMAFLCRPSPVFIEIAQKIAVWNGTWSSSDGVFEGWYQTRGKAWGIRSLTHAIFLTPQADAWRGAGASALYRNALNILGFRDSPKARLGFVWDYEPNWVDDKSSSTPGVQTPLWEHHYLTTELHKSASAKLLSGAQQTALFSAADWAARQPVRYIVEAAGGEWRRHEYLFSVGPGNDVSTANTWAEQFAVNGYSSAPEPGNWIVDGRNQVVANPAYYPAYFWSALVAAVERNVAGADAAWSRVNSGITNLSAWGDGFGSDPRWGAYPRNK